MPLHLAFGCVVLPAVWQAGFTVSLGLRASYLGADELRGGFGCFEGDVSNAKIFGGTHSLPFKQLQSCPNISIPQCSYCRPKDAGKGTSQSTSFPNVVMGSFFGGVHFGDPLRGWANTRCEKAKALNPKPLNSKKPKP